MTDNDKSICAKAITHYGELHQINKAIEEMAELTQELSKFVGYSIEGAMVNNHELQQRMLSKVSEEMADVEVVMAQLKLIFRNSETVEAVMEGKLARLQSRMGG